MTIRDSLGRESPSRVEDVTDGILVLARPLDLLVEHEFGIGEQVLVSWPAANGVTTATTELLESQLHGPLGLWVVQVIGELRVEQRRRFVRVPAIGPLLLVLIDADSGDRSHPLKGQLCSVSEGALRCTIPRPEADLLEAGLQAEAEFEFGKQDFTLPATVLRVEPCSRDRQLVEAVLIFQVTEDSAAALRRAVFAEQLRIRNGAMAH